MRILVSFLTALALQTQSVGAQSDAAMASEVTPDDTVDDTPGKDHDCTEMVEVARLCYDWDGPDYIEVKVDNCNAYGKDWIAIYEADSSGEVGYDKGATYWGFSKDWTYVCGDKDCDHSTPFNYLYFRNWWDNDALVNDKYRFYLFRDDTFRVDAESEVFTIKNEYHYCNGDKPSKYPTRHPTNKPSSHPPTSPPTHKPTLFPTFGPTNVCAEDTKGKFQLWKNNKEKKCAWAGKKKNKVDKRCNQKTKVSGQRVRDFCPRTCKTCGSSSSD